jgi:cytochrome P450
MRPHLRAAILESVRLWPTTPTILRQATREVDWGDGQGIVPVGASLVIHAPFLHRDPALPFADRFAPELWLDEAQGVRTALEGAAEEGKDGPLALVPFSLGPGLCPAANLVPMLGSAFLAQLLARRGLRLAEPAQLRPDRPMPGTLDPFTLAFDLEAARACATSA